MSDVVLDASALLAALNDETGADAVERQVGAEIERDVRPLAA